MGSMFISNTTPCWGPNMRPCWPPKMRPCWIRFRESIVLEKVFWGELIQVVWGVICGVRRKVTFLEPCLEPQKFPCWVPTWGYVGPQHEAHVGKIKFSRAKLLSPKNRKSNFGTLRLESGSASKMAACWAPTWPHVGTQHDPHFWRLNNHQM